VDKFLHQFIVEVTFT
ncbi:unnamed protein product, partial [Rotaria socialis]